MKVVFVVEDAFISRGEKREKYINKVTYLLIDRR
jgi:hypothetical protein